MPVSSGRATSGRLIADGRHAHRQSVAGVSTTSSRPARSVTVAVSARRARWTARGSDRRARARPGAGRGGPWSSRRSRRRRPAAATRGRRPGRRGHLGTGAVRPGAEQPDPGIGADQTDVDGASAGMARSARFASAWSSRGPPSAPRITMALGAPWPGRRGDGQLGVGLVLVDWRPFDRDPRRPQGGDAILAERVAVADPQIDA